MAAGCHAIRMIGIHSIRRDRVSFVHGSGAHHRRRLEPSTVPHRRVRLRGNPPRTRPRGRSGSPRRRPVGRERERVAPAPCRHPAGRPRLAWRCRRAVASRGRRRVRRLPRTTARFRPRRSAARRLSRHARRRTPIVAALHEHHRRVRGHRRRRRDRARGAGADIRSSTAAGVRRARGDRLVRNPSPALRDPASAGHLRPEQAAARAPAARRAGAAPRGLRPRQPHPRRRPRDRLRGRARHVGQLRDSTSPTATMPARRITCARPPNSPACRGPDS